MKKIFIYVSLFMLSFLTVNSQNDTVSSDKKDVKQWDCFIGSSLFVLGNLASDPPNFYQINLGYRITQRDVISIEAITWTYYGPLGRPYGPDHGDAASDFPGKVRAIGAGLAYQRFLWKQGYAQVHMTALNQNYLDLSGDKIQSGFQLFTALRVGYQFKFLKNRFFIEPSLAVTFWPVNTNLPDSFQAQEDRFNNYFIGEPGLHFGYNF
ncbi:hypothetical protein IMCC3317_14490 [Kordia antarctica]|uniref:DUF3575 domain-containing protein n=1 Tax=Kordia antarctica TaxID=1218801 RepID=A0A7L4ZHL5_9FLAO|nr:hypothetical protein [Kordia antarctica]QHI36095.1 hypothetical protein IMCC3317_14490 [Kordia antarctica]